MEKAEPSVEFEAEECVTARSTDSDEDGTTEKRNRVIGSNQSPRSNKRHPENRGPSKSDEEKIAKSDQEKYENEPMTKKDWLKYISIGISVTITFYFGLYMIMVHAIARQNDQQNSGID